jgi:predicted  nucleic acid-binding Zn-ribbon protein
MYISPAEAIRRYDVSKPTLYADMRDGKLSYQENERNKRRINVAELDRVYEKRPSGDQTSRNVQSAHDFTESNVKQPSRELEHLQQEVEFLKREIRARSEDIERWREAFDKAQATADKITALLEDKSGGARQSGENDKHIELLTKLLERQSEEGSVQNQKISTLEQTLEEVRTQNKRVLHEMKKREEAKNKEAAEENENKSFLKRLFG